MHMFLQKSLFQSAFRYSFVSIGSKGKCVIHNLMAVPELCCQNKYVPVKIRKAVYQIQSKHDSRASELNKSLNQQCWLGQLDATECDKVQKYK